MGILVVVVGYRGDVVVVMMNSFVVGILRYDIIPCGIPWQQ